MFNNWKKSIKSLESSSRKKVRFESEELKEMRRIAEKLRRLRV